MKRDGRLIVFTGNGKGKTTAALGTAFRALGHGQRVCVVQFLKGKGDYGERLFARNIDTFMDTLDWNICGRGFVFKKEDLEKDRLVAREGMELARKKILSDEFDLIILDELTYLIKYNFIEVDELLEILREKPERLSIIITGRDVHPALVNMADTVTSMEVVKHAFNAGVKAQKGIEF